MGRAFLPLALLALLVAGCTPTVIDPRVPLKIEPVMKTAVSYTHLTLPTKRIV